MLDDTGHRKESGKYFDAHTNREICIGSVWVLNAQRDL